MKPARAGWVRVERVVRPSQKLENPERTARLVLNLIERERKFMLTSPKANTRSYCVNAKARTLK